MSQNATGTHDVLGETIARLRADLERVTKERDTLIQHLVEATQHNVTTERELAETKAALEEANATARHNSSYWQEQKAHSDRELGQLRRAWALRELERKARLFDEGFGISVDNVCEGLPESVAALIRAGAGKPIGECDRCDRYAPLQRRQRTEEDGQFTTYESVCAPGWGCSEKGASDGG